MNVRRASWLVAALVVATPMPFVAAAAGSSSSSSVSPAHNIIEWTGRVIAQGDDYRTFTVDVPAGYWQHHPGGIVAHIQWAKPGTLLDLFVYRASGDTARPIALAYYGNVTYQQVNLGPLPNGKYKVDVNDQASSGSVSYSGSVRLVHQALPAAPLRSGGMQFARTLVDPQILAADPGITADGAGRVYVSSRRALGNPFGSFLWRSDDGAQTFRLVGDHLAGRVSDPRRRPCAEAVDAAADVDFAADRNGRVYMVDIGSTSVTAGYSTDHGRSWLCAPVPWAVGSPDRPWVVAAPTADGTGPGVDAYFMVQSAALVGQLSGVSRVLPEGLLIGDTRDGGRSWQLAWSGQVGTNIPGELFVGRHGEVYAVYSTQTAVWIVASHDGGRHFAVHLVSQRLGDPRGDGWTAGGVDPSGTVYAAWVDQGSQAVLFTRSRDGGAHWSTPVRVSPPGTTAMKVWLATGKTGDVALAWYAAPGTFPLYGPSPTTAWQVWSARSTNATASAPAFDVSQVSATPVGFGYMWSWSKAAISTASYFGDSLHLAIAPDGAVVVSYADVGNPSASEIAYVVAAHQVSGVGLTAPGRSLSGTPGLGLPVTLNSCPQLRFRSAPAVSVSRGVATVSIELRSARDFASIPVACGAALRPYVAWIAEWTTVGHREYAGAGVAWPDAASRPDVKYFGGMGPTYVGYHLPEALSPNIAAYPGRFALTGTLDPNTGRLSIDVPLQQFGLQAGQTLTDLQFFALIGTRQEPVPQAMARLIGQTPAVTLPLR